MICTSTLASCLRIANINSCLRIVDAFSTSFSSANTRSSVGDFCFNSLSFISRIGGPCSRTCGRAGPKSQTCWKMALTSRRGGLSCQAAATKVGSGDPAPHGTRVYGWRRFIIAFAKIFNGLLPRRAIQARKGLKWLHHSQNHDQDHEDCRNFVHDAIEPGWPNIGVGCESAHEARKEAGQPADTEDQDEFGL